MNITSHPNLADGSRIVGVKYFGDMDIEDADQDVVMRTWVMPTSAVEGKPMEPPLSWRRGETHTCPFWEHQIAAFEADPLFEVTDVEAPAA